MLIWKICIYATTTTTHTHRSEVEREKFTRKNISQDYYFFVVFNRLKDFRTLNKRGMSTHEESTHSCLTYFFLIVP